MGIKLDFSSLEGKNYSGYYFLKNPFPDIPVPDEQPEFVADRKEVIDTVYDVAVSSIKTGDSSTLLLLGVNGSGKSHILRYIELNINTQLKNGDNKGIAVYIRNPGESIFDLYTAIIENLKQEFIEDILIRNIRKFILDNDIKSFLKNKDDLEINNIINNDKIHELKNLIIEKVRVSDVFYAMNKKLGFKNEYYIRTLFKLLSEKNRQLVWKWIIGDNLSQKEKDELVVRTNIEEDDFVLSAISDLKMFLNYYDYKILFILLDESEDIVDLHHIKQGKYIQALRHLIDDNPNGLAFIMCIAPSAWSQIKDAGPALSRRLMYRREWLKQFKNEDVYELVKLYNEKARNEFFKSNELKQEKYKIMYDKKILNPELYPFTKDTLNYINNISEGLVSTIIQNCRTAINKGITENYEYFDTIEKLKFLEDE